MATISDDQSLFRHVVYPVSFKKKAFDSSRLFYLKSIDGVLLGSLVWERYVPTSAHVHGRGCRLAQRRNDEKRANGGLKERDRSVYCGAYHLKAGAIRAINGDQLVGILAAEVTHRPEGGEIAHTDLKVHLSEGPFDVEGTKTAFLDRLWHQSSGPLRHVCAYDGDIVDSHPNSTLTVAPRGPYVDERSWFSRTWYLLRFKLLTFVGNA